MALHSVEVITQEYRLLQRENLNFQQNNNKSSFKTKPGKHHTYVNNGVNVLKGGIGQENEKRSIDIHDIIGVSNCLTFVDQCK